MECDFHGITYDPHRNNWKARIHYEGKEQYIGRSVGRESSSCLFSRYRFCEPTPALLNRLH
jgi:hypothetical protein